jgi:transcriptional regulator with XRE-family HTH domain
VNVGLGVEREWGGFIQAFAETVKEIRMMLGLSQQDLANRAMTSQGTISRVESGLHPDVPFITVMKLLLTLSSDTKLIPEALRPQTRDLLGFIDVLRPIVPGLQASPPEPAFANLLLTLQSLTQTQRRTFVRLVIPIAKYVASDGTEDT